MTLKPKALTKAYDLADALGLSDEERKAADAILHRLDIGLDDPHGIPFVGLVKMQAVVDRLEKEIQANAEAANSEFVKNGKLLIAAIDRKLKENLTEQLGGLQFTISQEARSALQKENAALIAATVDHWKAKHGEAVRHNRGVRFLLTSILCLLVFMAGVLVGTGGGTTDVRLIALDAIRGIGRNELAVAGAFFGLGIGWLFWGRKRKGEV